MISIVFFCCLVAVVISIILLMVSFIGFTRSTHSQDEKKMWSSFEFYIVAMFFAVVSWVAMLATGIVWLVQTLFHR